MQTLENKRKYIVSFFLKKGLLINSELLNFLEDNNNFEQFTSVIENAAAKDIAVLSSRLHSFVENSNGNDINWAEIEKITAKSEKKGNSNEILDSVILHSENNKKRGNLDKSPYKVKVIFSYNQSPKKRDAGDFIQYFNQRYSLMEKLLKNRQELQNTLSISRVLGKKDREQISIIGMVKDKQFSKNGNTLLTVEDMSGEIKVLVNKNKPDLFALAKNIVLDETIGIAGVNGESIIFANSIICPDIPIVEEMKQCVDEVYALFLSDTHVGSNNFLDEDFNKFIKWINCDLGNEAQKNIASKVKYIFIVGDIVDGCGVYPGQEKDLKIKDIKNQYALAAELFSKIPRHIHIIISPGNHDAMRLAEPQLPIYKDFAEPIYNLPNVTMVSNPALINIHSSESFPGFDVLVYHGYSFDFYVAEVESIRNNGGYNRADLLMKFLLQKRHLAPSYTSAPYVPDTVKDCLVIEKAPDFFISGHIHKTAAANYRGVTLICGSCWQSKTAYQEKVGHTPEPSRVPLVNLQTRHIKILRFGKDS